MRHASRNSHPTPALSDLNFLDSPKVFALPSTFEAAGGGAMDPCRPTAASDQIRRADLRRL